MRGSLLNNDVLNKQVSLRVEGVAAATPSTACRCRTAYATRSCRATSVVLWQRAHAPKRCALLVVSRAKRCGGRHWAAPALHVWSVATACVSWCIVVEHLQEARHVPHVSPSPARRWELRRAHRLQQRPSTLRCHWLHEPASVGAPAESDGQSEYAEFIPKASLIGEGRIVAMEHPFRPVAGDCTVNGWRLPDGKH